jgi:hypothetical protein
MGLAALRESERFGSFFENAVEMRPDESIRDQPAFAGAAAIERRNGSGAAHYYHWVMNGSIDFVCLDTRWATVSMTLNSPPSWNSGEGFKVRLDQDGRRGHARGASGKQKYELQHVRLSRRDSKRARSIRSPLASYSNQARRCMFWPAIHISSWMTYSGAPYWGDHVLGGWTVGTAEPFATDCLQHSAKSSSPNRRLRIPVGLGLRRGVRNIFLQRARPDDLRLANAERNPESLVRWCFQENADQRIPAPKSCGQ